MNQDINKGTMSDASGTAATTDGQESGKSATYKRANRQGRNRPLLVTSPDAQAQSEASEAPAAGVATATTTTPAEVAPEKKSRPKFFSTIGKKEQTSETNTIDPAAARLSRATRNTTKPGEKKQAQETSKPAAKAAVPAKSTSARPAAPTARRGGFKPKHLIGILVYLLVADVAGLYERQLLVNNGLERLLFTIGPVQVTLSTVAFLLTLVVLLIVLARFDLVPRSLAPASQQRPAGKGTSQTSSSSNNSDGAAQPGMKQGVKGANDDLYRGYRENQRYWQRKDRKK